MHLFTTFKEYKHSDSSKWALQYASATFIETVISMEKIFLFSFHNFPHVVGFTKVLHEAIKTNLEFPAFCSEVMTDYLIKIFIKCRTFQCIKVFNQRIKEKDFKDKLVKLKHL